MELLNERQLGEKKFHDDWAGKVGIDSVSVGKYFTAPTAIEGRYVLQIIGPLKGRRVLDLGCGFGEASIWFALQEAEVTALDISSKMLKGVAALAKKYGVEEEVTLVKATAEKMPLESESFDLIFGGNVLHHVDIELAAREIKRVLKPGGKAFFIEPLGYNPVINIYRRIAKDVRTKMERPFTFKDIHLLSHDFRVSSHREFQLFTTLIFIWFFLGEGLHPSKVRYWKRFIEKGDNYKTAFETLLKIDNFVLQIPFLRRYCWNTAIELVK